MHTNDINYEHFDADEFFYQILDSTIELTDVADLLKKVPATLENFRSIRTTFITTADLSEFFEWLLINYGSSKILEDSEVMEKAYDIFDKEFVDILLAQYL